jgi:hypothetical protein
MVFWTSSYVPVKIFTSMSTVIGKFFLLDGRSIGEVLVAMHRAHDRRTEGQGAPPPSSTLVTSAARAETALVTSAARAGPAHAISLQAGRRASWRPPQLCQLHLTRLPVELLTHHGHTSNGNWGRA